VIVDSYEEMNRIYSRIGGTLLGLSEDHHIGIIKAAIATAQESRLQDATEAMHSGCFGR
jgi:hypothetical protein